MLGSSSATPFTEGEPSKSRALAVDIGITSLTAGGIVAGTIVLSRLANGPIKQVGSMLSDGLGLFLGPVLLLALLERITSPAGPRKPIHAWLLNFRINMFYDLIVIL